MAKTHTTQNPSGAVGIDFGTTNSSIALATGDGRVELVSFPLKGEETPSFRSVLYLEQMHGTSGARRVHSLSGPAAIHRYLEAEEKGRLIQSLKSHLSSRSLTGTEIFGRRHRLEDLISRMLKDLRMAAETQFGKPIRSATVGRPVRFVGADTQEDDDFAAMRLREAFMLAGFEHVEFEFEPIAAAYAYESTLDRDELILIGDFGGGTSDFSLLRVGPSVRKRGRTPEDLLGNSGIGLAGDAFDARIVRKLVSPALGSNSEARSLNKLLPAVPAWIYANLERWHYLSFLRTNNVREILKSARIRALEPEKIEALIALIDEAINCTRPSSRSSSNCRGSPRRSSTFATVVWTCTSLSHAAILRSGSRTTCVPSSVASMAFWRLPVSIPAKLTVSSLQEEAPSCPPSAASSRPALASHASAAATNLPPWPTVSPCAPPRHNIKAIGNKGKDDAV